MPASCSYLPARRLPTLHQCPRTHAVSLSPEAGFQVHSDRIARDFVCFSLEQWLHLIAEALALSYNHLSIGFVLKSPEHELFLFLTRALALSSNHLNIGFVFFSLEHCLCLLLTSHCLCLFINLALALSFVTCPLSLSSSHFSICSAFFSLQNWLCLLLT